MARPIPEEIRNKILELGKEGVTASKIVRTIREQMGKDISLGSVYGLLRRENGPKKPKAQKPKTKPAESEAPTDLLAEIHTLIDDLGKTYRETLLTIRGQLIEATHKLKGKE